MKVIVINGSGGCGKDTFVKYFRDAVIQSKGGVLNISTIDPIKDLAKTIGWDGSKDDKSRKFLSDLKDLTTNFNDYPMEYIRNILNDETVTFGKIACFIHCREPKEIERLKKEFNAVTLLLRRPQVEIITTNHADAEVENYNYDYSIINDSTLENLKEKAAEFANNLFSN